LVKNALMKLQSPAPRIKWLKRQY